MCSHGVSGDLILNRVEGGERGRGIKEECYQVVEEYISGRVSELVHEAV
jgi:hypothetical protein